MGEITKDEFLKIIRDITKNHIGPPMAPIYQTPFGKTHLTLYNSEKKAIGIFPKKDWEGLDLLPSE